MVNIDRLKVKQLLIISHDFIVFNVVKDDSKAQVEISDTFKQLISLLDT
jgi:hypothetical protein